MRALAMGESWTPIGTTARTDNSREKTHFLTRATPAVAWPPSALSSRATTPDQVGLLGAWIEIDSLRRGTGSNSPESLVSLTPNRLRSTAVHSFDFEQKLVSLPLEPLLAGAR